MGGQPQKAPAKAKSAAKNKSHIHQARSSKQPVILPKSGPMADMLKQLFNNKD